MSTTEVLTVDAAERGLLHARQELIRARQEVLARELRRYAQGVEYAFKNVPELDSYEKLYSAVVGTDLETNLEESGDPLSCYQMYVVRLHVWLLMAVEDVVIGPMGLDEAGRRAYIDRFRQEINDAHQSAAAAPR